MIRAEMSSRSGSLVAAMAVLAALAAFFSTPRRPPVPPNVVLIVLDTVRADHLSLYGHPVATSPRLEALARGATVYTRATAAASWTVPSHASMFTGRFAFEHGAHTLKLPRHREDGETEAVRPLDPGYLTLAEALAEMGYQTAAVVANAGFLNPRWGLDQGFERYVVQRGRAHVVNTRVRQWLNEERAKDRPFFLFVNYMDAHDPYNSAPREGLVPRPVTYDRGAAVEELYRVAMPGDREVPADLVQRVSDQYDTALANLDEEVGALLLALRNRGLLDDALVIVTSDHGEYLGEHNLVKHSKDVYQEVLAVPLVVKSPRQRHGRVEALPVSHVDVPRIVLAHLPRERAARYFPRFPFVPGGHPVLGENYYARARDRYRQPWSARFERVRTALYDWPYKLIASTDGRHELYDLHRDPRESRDLAAERGELRASLLRALASFQDKRGRYEGRVGPVEELDREELEELRALGYIGGGP